METFFSWKTFWEGYEVLNSLRLRLRLSKIRHIKIFWLKTKTKSDKWYFDFEIKTKTNETSFYKIKTKTRETEL